VASHSLHPVRFPFCSPGLLLDQLTCSLSPHAQGVIYTNMAKKIPVDFFKTMGFADNDGKIIESKFKTVQVGAQIRLLLASMPPD
jgi:hypothetical protein